MLLYSTETQRQLSRTRVPGGEHYGRAKEGEIRRLWVSRYTATLATSSTSVVLVQG
jgi:hypothetical protein